eukprot:gene2767-3394_t
MNYAALPHNARTVHNQVFSVFLMVDCGYHRDGVDPTSEEALALARAIHTSSKLRLQVCRDPATSWQQGLYTHGGHSYGAEALPEADRAAQVLAIATAERQAVLSFAELLRDNLKLGVGAALAVGVGSTPTCSVSGMADDALLGVTEMHPGNYVYFDVMQHYIGSCALADVACRVVCRVVSQYPSKGMLLVDLGWTGISAQGADSGYGCIEDQPEPRINGLPHYYSTRLLKQEAGEVEAADGGTIDFDSFPVGSQLR